jgi:hypothetical protein
MIKRTKPKEFFDSSLSEIKFSDLFSFQITTTIKPLFANISDTTKKKQKEKKAEEDAAAILNMQVGDENKYIIIADTAQNQVDRQQILSLKDWEDQIEALESLEKIAQITKSDPIQTASMQQSVELNTKVYEFVQSNLNFWITVEDALKDFNNLARVLKLKIESEG